MSRDEKGDEMVDRMSRRFGGESEPSESEQISKTEQTSKRDKTDKMSETDTSSQSDMGAETDKSSKTDESENVRERPSVLMYLPEEQHQELDLRFDELNLKHKREHGEALQKNRDYYPAVVEAALSEKTLEEILLDDE